MIGIDIADTEQIRNIYQKHGLLFLQKILDEEEISDLPKEKNRCFFQKLSCYIASKEAIFKACPEENLDWREISIHSITKNPLVHIKKTDFKKKIKLTFTVSRDFVLSQALII
jgi:phosphopantetheinyl transferase (holo-ACP synthase)